MKRTTQILTAGFTLILAAMACTLEAPPETEDAPRLATLAVQPTSTTLPPTATATSTESAVPLPTATELTTNTFLAEVAVASLNLRAGPGTMFDIVGQELQGTMVEVLGRAPGDEWVKVRVPDGTAGFMLAELLNLEGTIMLLPQTSISESYIVMGIVEDTEGEPINDISVAVYQGAGADTLRTDATTNEKGIFIAYLPLDSDYTWTVSVVGIGCESWIVDENCIYTGEFGADATVRFDLPQEEQITLLYEK